MEDWREQFLATDEHIRFRAHYRRFDEVTATINEYLAAVNDFAPLPLYLGEALLVFRDGVQGNERAHESLFVKRVSDPNRPVGGYQTL